MKLVMDDPTKHEIEQEKEQAIADVTGRVVRKKKTSLGVLEAIENLNDNGEQHVTNKEKPDEP